MQGKSKEHGKLNPQSQQWFFLQPSVICLGIKMRVAGWAQWNMTKLPNPYYPFCRLVENSRPVCIIESNFELFHSWCWQRCVAVIDGKRVHIKVHILHDWFPIRTSHFPQTSNSRKEKRTTLWESRSCMTAFVKWGRRSRSTWDPMRTWWLRFRCSVNILHNLPT